MTVKVRFAPSPTGYLHVGNLRTALINWLFAQHEGGTFLLRFDDTDTVRNETVYVDRIYADLAWLGITIDEEAQQSKRLERYAAQVAYLQSIGRLYPCYETPEELAFKRKQKLDQGKPPLYDRAALQLDAEARKAFEAEGREPHWRFKLEEKPIEWHDLVRGAVQFNGAHLSDPVLVRSDGSPIYTLASVVDDIDMQITHIVRGEDHVANTAIQIQLIDALGCRPKDFSFAHLTLVTDAQGDGLSKRLGSLSVGALQDAGVTAEALCDVLARLGTSDPLTPFTDMAPLIKEFSFRKFARATPKFSWPVLKTLNAQVLRNMPFSEVKKYFPEGRNITENFWTNVRTNLTNFQDVSLWWDICYGEVALNMEQEDIAFIRAACEHIAQWKGDDMADWFQTFKEESTCTGKEFFMPLRRVLTGAAHGPELQKILQLMGRQNIQSRFEKVLSA